MPTIGPIFEWRFVDPATIVNGCIDGRKVVELYGPGHAVGPPLDGFFARRFGRWPDSLDKFAEAQADYALHLETTVDRHRAKIARAATRTTTRTHLAKIEVQ